MQRCVVAFEFLANLLRLERTVVWIDVEKVTGLKCLLLCFDIKQESKYSKAEERCTAQLHSLAGCGSSHANSYSLSQVSKLIFHRFSFTAGIFFTLYHSVMLLFDNAWLSVFVFLFMLWCSQWICGLVRQACSCYNVVINIIGAGCGWPTLFPVDTLMSGIDTRQSFSLLNC